MFIFGKGLSALQRVTEEVKCYFQVHSSSKDSLSGINLDTLLALEEKIKENLEFQGSEWVPTENSRDWLSFIFAGSKSAGVYCPVLYQKPLNLFMAAQLFFRQAQRLKSHGLQWGFSNKTYIWAKPPVAWIQGYIRGDS